MACYSLDAFYANCYCFGSISSILGHITFTSRQRFGWTMHLLFTMAAIRMSHRYRSLAKLVVYWRVSMSPWDELPALSLEIDLGKCDWLNVGTWFDALVVAPPVLEIGLLLTNPMMEIDDVRPQYWRRWKRREHLFGLVIGFEWLVGSLVVVVVVLHCPNIDGALAIHWLMLCYVPYDSCSCLNAWWSALMCPDPPCSKNSTLQRHNDENQPWTSQHMCFPSVFPKCSVDVMCANDERSTPKYPLFLVLQHFHPPERKRKRNSID